MRIDMDLARKESTLKGQPYCMGNRKGLPIQLNVIFEFEIDITINYLWEV